MSADPDDGLLYMRARYRDPGLGVFVSRDPIGLRGGLKLYGYVNNNPVKFADATGKYAVIPIAAGAGIVISCIAAKADEMALAVVLYFSDEDVRRDVDGIRERAEMATRGMYAWENADRNKANFMPHCVALCEVSRIYGSAFARTGGLWNEVSGATGVSWTDLKNNEIGISIGVTASSFKNCIKKCKDAAEAGKAVAMVD